MRHWLTRLSYFLLLTAIAEISVIGSADAADCTTAMTSPMVKVEITDANHVQAGSGVDVRWSSIARANGPCAAPLYLVLMTNARVRFAGEGFLAMPPGDKGPYGISDGIDQTRVFIPLHALPTAASGTFKIKFYTAGMSSLTWSVVGVPNASGASQRTPMRLSSARAPLRVEVVNGRPAIVVRDSFTPDIANSGPKIERPRKIIVSNSGEFELQIFQKFYRIYDVRSGELVLERGGANPNFSPSSRFVGALAEGDGFEIIDLYADTVVASSGNLNRRGGYEGTAHVAAWSHGDAIVALSFWGWGGVYLQQTLVDDPGVGNGMPSCHACQGIGVDLYLDWEAGLVAWFGQQNGWGSLYEPRVGSDTATKEAEAQVPDENAYEQRAALASKLARRDLEDLGRRYLFNPAPIFTYNQQDAFVTDGSAWHLGGETRLSHACTEDPDDNCTSAGEESAEGRAKLKALTARRVAHRVLQGEESAGVQLGDARILVAQARAGGAEIEPTRNIWSRLEQLGIQASAGSRIDVGVQHFDWQALYDKPSLFTDQFLADVPTARSLIKVRDDKALLYTEIPPDNGPMLTIDPKQPRATANWHIGGTRYWLLQEDYQDGNSSTPQNQYLHLVSSADGGPAKIIDLSTRLDADGTLAKSIDQTQLPDHPWPSDLDRVTIVANHYLLASGQWLHDGERWALAYDLKDDAVLFFNGHLPEGTAMKAMSISPNGKLFIVSNRNGRIYFYTTATGEQILSGNYLDDEIVVFSPDGYYMSTYEGSQFVFLKFPGLAGYLSFKQFARTLNRPDLIRSILAGSNVAAAPDLRPPPHLSVKSQIDASGILHLSLSLNSTVALARLRLFIDGQSWMEQKLVAGTDASETLNLSVPPQSKWLTAVVVDAAGSESIPVTLPLKQDPRTSSRKLYLVGVGTNQYPNLPKDRQLRFAAADAQNFLNAVRAQKNGYYGNIETRSFLDATDLKTTLPNALRAIVQSATQSDTIMLFVSGHGYRSQDNKLYLVVKETAPNNIEGTSIAWDDLAHVFDAAKARIIVFIDACHAGAAPDGGSNDEIVDALSAHRVRFTVMAAAKGREQSYEGVAAQSGVFTDAIVKAITVDRGNVDTNRNGVIELSELYSKIKPAILKEMNGRQTPWLARADMVGDVPLF